jgi:hypothetical protein
MEEREYLADHQDFNKEKKVMMLILLYTNLKALSIKKIEELP